MTNVHVEILPVSRAAEGPCCVYLPLSLTVFKSTLQVFKSIDVKENDEINSKIHLPVSFIHFTHKLKQFNKFVHD